MPYNVKKVDLVEHNDTEVILQWDMDNKYNYTLECNNNSCKNISITKERNNVKYHISDLIPATNYIFIVYTEFFDVRSTGYNLSHTTSK